MQLLVFATVPHVVTVNSHNLVQIMQLSSTCRSIPTSKDILLWTQVSVLGSIMTIICVQKYKFWSDIKQEASPVPCLLVSYVFRYYVD